jgi:hypothetical protein
MTLEHWLQSVRELIAAARAQDVSPGRTFRLQSLSTDLDDFEKDIALQIEQLQRRVSETLTGTDLPPGPLQVALTARRKADQKTKRAKRVAKATNRQDRS